MWLVWCRCCGYHLKISNKLQNRFALKLKRVLFTQTSEPKPNSGAIPPTPQWTHQVIICTSTLAWGVNFPAHLVVIKGTEFFDGKLKRYVDFPITGAIVLLLLLLLLFLFFILLFLFLHFFSFFYFFFFFFFFYFFFFLFFYFFFFYFFFFFFFYFFFFYFFFFFFLSYSSKLQ